MFCVQAILEELKCYDVLLFNHFCHLKQMWKFVIYVDSGWFVSVWALIILPLYFFLVVVGEDWYLHSL